MPDPDQRTRLQRDLLLARSDADALSALIVRLRSAPVVDEARLERATERWIETNIRAGELRDELERLDREAGS